MKLSIAFLSLALVLSAQQTKVNLGAQSGNANFSAFSATSPLTVVSSAPGTCIIGQLYFNSGAVAGSNIFGCTSTNTWTLQGGTGGGGYTGFTLTMPSIFSVSPSTITTAGTVSFVSQSQGLFLASPAASSGAPLMRAIALSDLPIISVAKGGNGTATPALTAGTNVTLIGTWPNYTINSTASGMVYPAGSGVPLVVSGTSWGTTLTLQGNGTKAQLSTGTTTTNDCVKFDANGNTVDSGSGCGGGGSVNTPAVAGNYYQGATSAGSAVPMVNPVLVQTLANGLGTVTAGSTNLSVNVSMSVRAVTTTTDTLLSTDCGGLVTYNNAGAVAVAIPQAGLAGNFAAGCPITARNYGAGTVTFTPSVSTIGNGATTQALTTGKACLIVSDGTNYQLGACN